MNLTRREIGCIDFSLKVSEKKNHDGLFLPRTHELKDQVIVLDIYKKIRPFLDDKDMKNIDVKFSTEEKALLLKLLNRELPVDTLEEAVSVRAKLK